MPDNYFILEKTNCENCTGTGLFKSQAYNPATGQKLAIEQDCKDCKGKGYTYEPVELDWNLFDEVIKSFYSMREK